MTTEQMDASDDYWRKRLGVPELDGATTTPPEGVMLGSAGEFAARWNSMEPAQREAVWTAMQGAANDGYRCHLEDHESLKAELSAYHERQWGTVEEVDKLLADELYDGGNGAMSEFGFEQYRANLARKLVRAFGTRVAPDEAWCSECAGPYPLDEWPGNQYAGHWDTCPNRHAAVKAEGKE